jgi:hypothetical protein
LTSGERLSRDLANRGHRARDAARPRVYLHIGEPKTGTTFLQKTTWASRDRMAAQGVLLPGYSHRDHSLASRDVRDAPRVDSDPAASWVGDWDVLTGQALRAPGAALISDEVLVACTPAQADHAVRSLLPAEVHIILTVRDIAALLPAEWQETVKCGATTGWDEWLKGVIGTAPAADRRRRSWFWTVHGTLANLAMWSAHIPPDHVHVITVPREAPADELWVRFASVLGIDPRSADVHPRRANASLGLAETEFLRRMNEALPGDMPTWFYTRNIKQTLTREVLGTRPRAARLHLRPDEHAWAREQSETLVAGLRDARYHVVGDLAELLPQPEADGADGHAGHAGADDLPAEQLLYVAVHAAAALADHQYRGSEPTEEQRPRSRGPKQMAIRLEWALLNGRTTRRMLRRASHLAPVRRLRVAIWRLLMHPSRHP